MGAGIDVELHRHKVARYSLAKSVQLLLARQSLPTAASVNVVVKNFMIVL